MRSAVCIDSVLRLVVRRGFPELARKRISLSIGEYDEWMYYVPAGPGSFTVGVDVSLCDAPRGVIAGGLAHELAHIVRDERMGRWRLERARVLYASSLAFRMHDERETDREAVARGYGRELLALMLYGRARGYVWGREDGLTLPEVHRMVGRYGRVRHAS